MTSLFRLSLALVLCSLTALGADRITALIVVTNGTVNGDTITVNGATRTWTNNVVTPATQVLTNSTPDGAATNLFQHFALSPPFTGAALLWGSSTNGFSIVGLVGGSMSVTFGGTWGEVSYTTNTVTQLQTVRVPLSSLPSAQRIAHAGYLVEGIEDYSTEAFDQTSTAMSEVVGLGNNQTITGNKTFTGTTTIGAGVTTTNLINRGNAISSPGPGTNSEQFGNSATATNTSSTAVGYAATAYGENSVAIGNGSIVDAAGNAGVALGTSAEVTAINGLAVGVAATVSGTSSTAIGRSATTSTYTNAVAIGYQAQATADNQIRLGTSASTVSIAGVLEPAVTTNSTYYGTLGLLTGGYLTNNTTSGQTHTNAANYKIRFPRTDYTSLANGDNSGIDFGSATFVKIDAGPTAAYTIAGIAGGTDGRLLILNNRVAFNLTIGHEDGAEATPANRIVSPTGADLTSTTHCVVMLVYDTEDSRWHVINFQD